MKFVSVKTHDRRVVSKYADNVLFDCAGGVSFGDKVLPESAAVATSDGVWVYENAARFVSYDDLRD